MKNLISINTRLEDIRAGHKDIRVGHKDKRAGHKDKRAGLKIYVSLNVTGYNFVARNI